MGVSVRPACASLPNALRSAGAAMRGVFFLDIANFVPYMCFINARNAPAARWRAPLTPPIFYIGPPLLKREVKYQGKTETCPRLSFPRFSGGSAGANAEAMGVSIRPPGGCPPRDRL